MLMINSTKNFCEVVPYTTGPTQAIVSHNDCNIMVFHS